MQLQRYSIETDGVRGESVKAMRIAYVVNHCAFFVSHRLPLALTARQEGFAVHLLTGQAGSQEMEQIAVAELQEAGVPYQRTVFRSSGMNPVVELLGVLQLVWLMLKFRPDLVHCASPKGVLYGGIAARICRISALVMAVSGMGYAYTQGTDSGARIWVRRIYNALAGFAFHHPNSRIIVQNQDDRQAVIAKGLAQQSSVVLIPGSGVDLRLFADCAPVGKAHMVLLPARMLKDKGVYEFVAAARKLRALVPQWRFVMAGAAGYDNPSAIEADELRAWQAEGCVQWLGHVDDMLPLYREAAIVCLPSYREGMPKSLLEAAAAGCAVVTTDVIGCRDSVVPGVTGDLVPVKDCAALSAALLSLIDNQVLRESYGTRGQERAKALFSVTSVVEKTVAIYKNLLDHV